jgi:hypothetical protein
MSYLPLRYSKLQISAKLQKQPARKNAIAGNIYKNTIKKATL